MGTFVPRCEDHTSLWDPIKQHLTTICYARYYVKTSLQTYSMFTLHFDHGIVRKANLKRDIQQLIVTSAFENFDFVNDISFLACKCIASKEKTIVLSDIVKHKDLKVQSDPSSTRGRTPSIDNHPNHREVEQGSECIKTINIPCQQYDKNRSWLKTWEGSDHQ